MKSNQSNKFIIEGYNSDDLSITFKKPIKDGNVDKLKNILDVQDIPLNLLNESLTDDQIRELKKVFREWSNKTDAFVVRKTRVLDLLSYELHTGRELELMLNGNKPLSVFVDEISDSYQTIPEDSFDGYVQTGKIIKKEAIRKTFIDENEFELRYVLYALPNEEWRVAAYMDNVDFINKNGSSAKTEKKEGTLLGYTEEQNNEYLMLIQTIDSH